MNKIDIETGARRAGLLCRRGWPGSLTDEWPDALILLGDQLYADELTPDEQRRVNRRRSSAPPAQQAAPPDEVVSFAEYERLYRHSWGDPEIRWLMSTVPTAMIFDDHDIRDDWNTSASWRVEVNAESRGGGTESRPAWRRTGSISIWAI